MECVSVYSVPVMIMLKLKVVMLPALDVADSVSVAEMELPAARTAPPRFQVKVR